MFGVCFYIFEIYLYNWEEKPRGFLLSITGRLGSLGVTLGCEGR